MEQFSTEPPRDDNLLLGSKDPQLSRVFGDGPNTPSGIPANDVTSQSVMDESGQFHDDQGRDIEYRLFEEQSYVPVDLSPANHHGLAGNTGSSIEIDRKSVVRRNGPTNGKGPFSSEAHSAQNSFTNRRAMEKHHVNIQPGAIDVIAERGVTVEATNTRKTSIQQDYVSTEVVTSPTEFHRSSSAILPQYHGPPLNQTNSAVNINSNQSADDLTAVMGPEFNAQQAQDNANQCNMQLLNQRANRQLTQPQQASSSQQNDYRQHQSSIALQEIAMSVNLRSSQCATAQEAMSSSANQIAKETAKSRQFMTSPGHITGVRAQLRKSLSDNGKLQNINASSREWSRLPIAVGRSLDSATGSLGYVSRRMQQDHDPANIDNAPILKNLLADSKSERRLSASDNSAYAQENGHLTSPSYTKSLQNSWPSAAHPNSLRSPLLEAKRSQFQYCVNISEQGNPNPSPMHSPSYANSQQFTLPQPQSHHNTPLPQNEQQFFAADIVNTANGPAISDDSVEAEKLDEMLTESENFVQDLIDAEASSNQSQQPQIPPFRDPDTQRMTPPPAYAMEQGVGVIQNEPMPMYMGQSQDVKSEPQSPMIMSPMAQRSFFGAQNNPMTMHPNSLPLASPTTPHPVPMHHGMHPQTPVGENNWHFTMSVQTQNYGNVPPSPVASGPVDNIVQNINYLPQPAQQTVPTTTKARNRRASGGAARKNADGTLSCAICGHTFRSVPALNGHMRVHSSSSERKNKDERIRKASGSSSTGNEPRTPRTLSSPSTPTYNVKANQPVSMYQNPGGYNSVTLPGYSNPNTLYSPAVNTMNAAGAVVPITQNMNARDASLVHRITPQVGIYPYQLQHTTMQPHDALIAAANLLARSEPEHFLHNASSAQDDFIRNQGLQQVTDLQQLIAQQHAAGQSAHHFRGTPPSSVILVPQQHPSAHSYIQNQAESLPGSSASMPFVTAVSLSAAGSNIVPSSQSYASSSPDDQTTNSSQVDNIAYLHQSLIQQASNRSTPLADFADIAVLHDQGQLFTNNTGLAASIGSQSQTLHHQDDGHGQNPEQIRLQEVQPGLMPSGSNEMMWRNESQRAVSMQNRDQGRNIVKEENMLQSPMAQIHQANEQINQSQTDPMFFPVSIPVERSQGGAPPVTSAYVNFYRNNSPSASFSFHDDPLMQEATNVANPSTILPNSMMGGNPGGFRSSIRQRHHSEGSVLKKPFPDAEIACKQELNASIANFETNPHLIVAGMNDAQPIVNAVDSKMSPKPSGLKRKSVDIDESHDLKRVKMENIPEPCEDHKKEVWSVPKHAAPNRLRHRRHSADSRPQCKSLTLLPRAGHFSAFQNSNRAANTVSSPDGREKRRPPPLFIPPSVNAYSNGSLYISQLHHRRRPSGDSVSSCGNDKIPPYTPPPMLSPLRLGTGLYHKTPITPSNKTLYRQGSVEHCPIPPIPEEEDDDLVRSADPKINIGDDYQADIPKLCRKWKVHHDVHKAEQVWNPTDELMNENSTQSRHVEEYLKLACSAAVPFGGCNKEFALHLLYKNNGDILTCVRQLLHSSVTVPSDHSMASYTYLGTSKWSLRERQTFDTGMLEHLKDFYKISRIIRTKTTAECVDYYYNTVKRRRRRVQRPRRFRRDSEEDNRVSFSPSPDDNESNVRRDFLQDYLSAADAAAVQHHEVEVENKRSEVLRRSPMPTAFIQAPVQVHRISAPTAQSVLPPAIYSQVIPPQMHTYARQGAAYPQQAPAVIPSTRDYVPPHQRQQPRYPCKTQNCGLTFPTVQNLIQHQQSHKQIKPFLDRISQASPSPSSSPVTAPCPEPDVPQFQCPRCGKSFSKVKSRNAHMKTHGKQAQEKRKLKEEEQRRKMEEAAVWRNRAQHHQPGIMHPGREQVTPYQHQRGASSINKQARM